MSEAPERIWAMAPHIGEFYADPPVNDEDKRFLTEYVRADLLPVVKPLVWLGDIADSSFAKWQWTAEIYMIEERNHAPNVFDLICNSWDVEQVKRFESLEAAQAAAQADHEARIRTSLDMIDPAALVAGAYEAVAQLVLRQVDGPMKMGLSQDIRALTPADAQRALDAAKRNAVNEKLDDVVKLQFVTDQCEGWCETSDEQGVFVDCTACEMTNAILAMKEE